MRDDWHRAYVMKLGKLGLDIPPDIFERARERLVAGIHHRHALLAFAAWPLASGASIRSTSATSSGSSASTRAGTRSTARSGRRSARAPIPPTASCRSASSTWRRRSAGPAGPVRVRGRSRAPGRRRPHALLLLHGVPLARRVQPRPLHRRSQLPRPLPRLGGLGGRPGPGVRARRRRDADRPAPPVRGQSLDARRTSAPTTCGCRARTSGWRGSSACRGATGAPRRPARAARSWPPRDL